MQQDAASAAVNTIATLLFLRPHAIPLLIIPARNVQPRPWGLLEGAQRDARVSFRLFATLLAYSLEPSHCFH